MSRRTELEAQIEYKHDLIEAHKDTILKCMSELKSLQAELHKVVWGKYPFNRLTDDDTTEEKAMLFDEIVAITK